MSNNIGQSAAPLSWDYGSKWSGLPARETTYRGFTAYAVQDSDAENPFTAWDTEPPTLVYTGRRDGFSDYSGDTLENPLAAISDARLARKWAEAAKALAISADAYALTKASNRADYGTSAADTRREMAEEALADMRNGSGSDYLEALATLWRIAGCVAETWSAHGYSQGDYAEGLSVATPEWAKKVGAPKKSHADQCRYAGKLYGYWAFGDVYGYVVADASDDHLDSCWGFYGDDFEESGLADAAREVVDGIISARAKRRQRKASEVIKARVPLALRPALLNQAEAGV